MLWRAAELMATTFCMTGSRFAACAALLPQSVNEPTFRDVCTESGKWFHAGGELFRRAGSDETFAAKMRILSMRAKSEDFSRGKVPCSRTRSGLVPDRRKQVAAATDGADHGGLGRVRLDLAADAHDPEIDRAVEGFGVAGVG